MGVSPLFPGFGALFCGCAIPKIEHKRTCFTDIKQKRYWDYRKAMGCYWEALGTGTQGTDVSLRSTEVVTDKH